MSQLYNLSMPQRATEQTWRRNQNTVKFQSSARLGPVSHTIIIAIMLAVLGLIYLTQVTKTSAYGYDINELSAKKENLLREQDDLKVEAARLQALESVQNSNVAKAMEAPKQTDYARP